MEDYSEEIIPPKILEQQDFSYEAAKKHYDGLFNYYREWHPNSYDYFLEGIKYAIQLWGKNEKR